MTISPAAGQGTTIAYNLTEDADINIYIFNIGGSLVYHQVYPAGTSGGHSGYNAVFYDGKVQLTKEPLALGIYTYKITAGIKMLAQGRVVVIN
jgi:hypothetical protein